MPIDVWAVLSAEQWVIVPMTCFLIAFISPPREPKPSEKPS
jgi:hypothetical protein